MILRTPSFWKSRSWRSYILLPFAWCYFLVSRLICLSKPYPYKASIPVICIGNVTLGGSGKTPVSIAIGQFLIRKGLSVAYLSRGYGGILDGPLLVDLSSHSSKQVGDEPLLLSQIAPTWISKNRAEGAKEIEKHGADIIIMDDGLQNTAIHKDISLLVINGQYGIGNGFLFPAGPLREPLPHALVRSQAIILLECSQTHINTESLPLISAFLKAKAHSFPASEVIAFAGIAHPQRFFNTLKNSGIKIKNTHSFPDHYPYHSKEIDALLDEARQYNIPAVTTEKDWVRLPKKYQSLIHAFPISLNWNDESQLEYILRPVIQRDMDNK